MTTENTADPQKWTGYHPIEADIEMERDFIKTADEILEKYPDSSPYYKRAYVTSLGLYLSPDLSLQERHEVMAFAKEALDRNGFASWTVWSDDGTEYIASNVQAEENKFNAEELNG